MIHASASNDSDHVVGSAIRFACVWVIWLSLGGNVLAATPRKIEPTVLYLAHDEATALQLLELEAQSTVDAVLLCRVWQYSPQDLVNPR